MASETSTQGCDRIPRCCCGQNDCPYLAHTGALLEELERDVRTAAQMGQALLIRHENYMADAEQERIRLNGSIEKLEMEKQELEEKNAHTIDENRKLLDQLEELNTNIAESDEHLKSITASLHSTQEELQRVMVLAARTELLEKQLTQLEEEQAQLQESLESAVEDEKSTLQRWKQAERTINHLQDQIDRIEREAREEGQRHVDIISRMERRRAVEKDLETAADRLKSAAAAKSAAGDDQQGNNNVVSHFVKDILQDNANLQVGIMELREMLFNSNEEVERLREQLMVHQPLDLAVGNQLGPTLQAELGLTPTQSREFHVHHHYHAPAPAPAKVEESPKVKTPLQRRAKRRRHVASPAYFATPSRSHTPRSSISELRDGASQRYYHSRNPSSAATILSQTSVTVPQSSNRWSIQSSQTGASIAPSSAPGSPYSQSHRASSLFERVFSDGQYESSRPTSPESNPSTSPILEPTKVPSTPLNKVNNRKLRDKDVVSSHNPGQRSFSSPLTVQIKSVATSAITEPTVTEFCGHFSDIDELNLSPAIHPTIPEENEDRNSEVSIDPDPTPDVFSSTAWPSTQPLRGLRRAASHDSLISVSGMDIHTLRSRPSQLLSPAVFSPSSVSSNSPIMSTMTTQAHATLSSQGLGNSRSLLHGMAEPRSRGQPISSRASNKSLGEKVGGWVFGKWGFSPSSPSPASLTSHDDSNANKTVATRPSSKASSDTSATDSKEITASESLAAMSSIMGLRSPGVNQMGPIWGLGPERKLQTSAIITKLDQEALRETLDEV